MTTGSIVIANLQTTERLFNCFEIEMWDDDHSTLLSQQLARGTYTIATRTLWGIPSSVWTQSSAIVFRNLTVGTTYNFRARVIPTLGKPSEWEEWQTEVCGDNTAPSADYTARVVAAVHRAVNIKLNPASASSDIARYEVYQSASATTPSASVVPVIKDTSGNFLIPAAPATVLYYWCRAVDTSGNQQTWFGLGGYIAFADDQVITGDGTAWGIFPPTAYIASDVTSGTAPLTVVFDATTNSYTVDGASILRYEWDFGDGSARSYTANPTHIYTLAGYYTAYLTVYDSRGVANTDSIIITAGAPVGNTPPVAVLDSDYSTPIMQGDTVSFDGTGSSDPDGGDTISYHWDFGNGRTAIGSTASCTYMSGGHFIAVLTVTDNHGASSNDFQSIVVERWLDPYPTE